MKLLKLQNMKLAALEMAIAISTIIVCQPAMAADQIRVVPKIADNRKEAAVYLSTATGLDVTCESLVVTVKLRDNSFGDPNGDPAILLKNAYGNAKSTTGIKVDLKEMNIDSKNVIHNISVEQKNCRRASFKEYCENSSLSEAESNTVLKVLSYFGAKRCVDFNDEDASKLSLRGEGIESLRPLVYLSELKRVYLQKNAIASIEDLKHLPTIELLEISKNPVTNIEILGHLPLLKELDIAHTNVSDISPLKKLKYLKTINMRKTKVTELAPLVEMPSLKKACSYENNVTDYEKNKKRIDELNEFCLL